jgi:hypothetical protein
MSDISSSHGDAYDDDCLLVGQFIRLHGATSQKTVILISLTI